MSAPATFETFQQELAGLVERFDRGFPQFKSPDYNEATLRADFLDPLFRALGWDVGNTKGLIHTEREVDIEVRTATSGRQTRAGYVFRFARVERFTCEAKKPAEPRNDRHIYQAKRDAFNRGVPVALLSDFEELKIYIVGSRPHRGEPHVGEFKVLNRNQSGPIFAPRRNG
jgi:predicted type IV restriction endonuclease